MPLNDIDLILIENVGNLICPSEFVLGEHKRVVISSLPEGDDKPTKYPLIFMDADSVIVNKIDLLPYLDFDITAFLTSVSGLNPKAKIFQVSCKTGEGLDRWCSWLLEQVSESATER
jgi:hydrogenase nickel incorporation protein HypB